jgi:hypothetical protein
VRFFERAGTRGHQLPPAVQHDIQSKVNPGEPGDRQRFLVQRIARESAVACRGVVQELESVEIADSLQVGKSRAHGFAAAGESGHEMRLDQPGDQPESGIDKPRVELDPVARPTSPW